MVACSRAVISLLSGFLVGSLSMLFAENERNRARTEPMLTLLAVILLIVFFFGGRLAAGILRLVLWLLAVAAGIWLIVQIVQLLTTGSVHEALGALYAVPVLLGR